VIRKTKLTAGSLREDTPDFTIHEDCVVGIRIFWMNLISLRTMVDLFDDVKLEEEQSLRDI
jgi:hypothetical protein